MTSLKEKVKLSGVIIQCLSIPFALIAIASELNLLNIDYVPFIIINLSLLLIGLCISSYGINMKEEK